MTKYTRNMRELKELEVIQSKSSYKIVKAQDPNIIDLVVVKVFPKYKENVQKIKHEVEIMMHLSSYDKMYETSAASKMHVLPLLSHFYDKNLDHYGYSMPYHRLNLELLLLQSASNSLAAKEVTTQILAGLNYIHTHGVAHLNINPQTIFVSTNGEIKIGGFDNARFMPRAHNETIPRADTPIDRYRAPEVMLGKKQNRTNNLPSYSYESDIWSAGLIALELYITSMKPETRQELGISLPERFCADEARIFQTALRSFGPMSEELTQRFMGHENSDSYMHFTGDYDLYPTLSKLIQFGLKRMYAGDDAEHRHISAINMMLQLDIHERSSAEECNLTIKRRW